jgi:uncharacterized Zn finger protein
MPRESYRKCPECNRSKGVEGTMAVGTSDHVIDVVRCTACGAMSIGSVVVRTRYRKTSVVNEPEVRRSIAKALRAKADSLRRHAASLMLDADECEREAENFDVEVPR